MRPREGTGDTVSLKGPRAATETCWAPGISHPLIGREEAARATLTGCPAIRENPQLVLTGDSAATLRACGPSIAPKERTGESGVGAEKSSLTTGT